MKMEPIPNRNPAGESLLYAKFTLAAVLGALLFCSSAAIAAPPAKLALTGARVITVSGDDLRNATVLIEHGKITAVGKDVKIPYDAMEIDCSGKVLFPGMIDPHSWRGLDIANESLAVTPYVDVYDAIDPSRLFFEESLRKGITSVHVIPGDNCVIGGQSRVVRPIGLTPDEMTVRAEVALKLSASPKSGFDRMLQLHTLRGTFSELDDYLGRVAERRYEQDLKEKDEPLTVGPEEARKRGKDLVRMRDLDDAHRNLERMRRGVIGAWVYAGAAMDVRPAIALAEEQGFLDDTVLVLGSDAARAVSELKKAGRPVIVPVDPVRRDRDPITGEVSEEFVPSVLYKAGLTFALQPSTDASLAERFLNYQAARCVRNGIPRSVALKAITLNPAQMLGLGDQLGSIEVGKIANIVVFDADPLDFNAKVEHVYIDGIHAYDRARDPRIQDLLPEPEAAEEALAPADEADTDDAGDEPKTDDAPAGGDGGDGDGSDNGSGGGR